MIPIRDTIQAKNYPVVNNIIIGFNVLLYVIELTKGQALSQFIYTYGLVPARYSVPEISSYFSISQQIGALFTFMFIHGGFFHLLGNMWFLYIFGDNVEDRLGHVRYLFFYLLCGWASGILYLFINWHSRVPTIGASGAIAGVMGAYFISYPKARILTLIPLFFIPYFIEIPAFFFLGIWFLLQFLSATASHSQAGGIAWWAHIGGFVAGVILMKLFFRVPELGITRKLREIAPKRKPHRLQVIHSTGPLGDPDLRGEIVVTPQEARFGAQKLVNIPWGFQRRLFRVTVPSGVGKDSVIRLRGMGRKMSNGRKGDLYLRVRIRP